MMKCMIRVRDGRRALGGHVRVRFRVLFRVRVRVQDFFHVRVRVRSSKKSLVRVRPSLI